MRLRICRKLTGSIDGVSLDAFRSGVVYDLGTELAWLFLAEGWAELVTDAPPAPADNLSNRINPVVLVVEDDAQLRQMAADMLACSGYEVVQARDGREAIAQLQAHAPDLVLLDLNMPVMDGWQFCAEQRRLPERRLATIPVVLLTAVEAAQGHATLLQAAGLVTKPFDPDTLIATVRTALRH